MQKNIIMKLKKLHILVCITLSSLGFAQSTYTNGSIATGQITKSGVLAPTLPAQHQWSELQNNSGNTTQTNNISGYDGYFNGGNTDLRVFDDFTVPFGQTWNIENVDVFCYQLDFLGSASPLDILRVRIWSGFPYLNTSTVVAGNMTTNIIDLANCEDTYTLRISNTQIPTPGTPPTENKRIWKIRGNITASLTAGRYWIEYQGKAVNNASFKFIPTTTIDSRGNGNANQYNVISNTFSSLSDTGSPYSSPDVQQDLAFNINYTTPLSTVLNSKTNFSIYPNPASDILNIEVENKNDNYNYQINDIMGKVIKSGIVSTESILIDDLKNGVYFLSLSSENERFNIKFIKQN